MARGLGKGIDVLIPEVKHSTGKDVKEGCQRSCQRSFKRNE